MSLESGRMSMTSTGMKTSRWVMKPSTREPMSMCRAGRFAKIFRAAQRSWWK